MQMCLKKKKKKGWKWDCKTQKAMKETAKVNKWGQAESINSGNWAEY